jgi:hypothetical protein
VIRRLLGSGAREGMARCIRAPAGRPAVNGGPQTADYSTGFNLSVALGTMRLGPSASQRAGIKDTP